MNHREPTFKLPAALSPLAELATNLWWTWDDEGPELMASVDPDHWEQSRQNPVVILSDLSPRRAEHLTKDTDFLAKLDRVLARFRAYLIADDTWARQHHPELAEPGAIAYFSMEFGVHSSVRIYSGGLGVLAGDHVRSASDLGLGLVGVGLLYRQGYFRQLIDDGHQVAAFPNARFERLPLRLMRDEHAKPIRVPVPYGHHTFTAQVWELRVGRTRLLLLDTDHDGNPFEHRTYTQQLYGGDDRTRIAQEVLLGIGGVRALQALGIEPKAVHLNEGHCAFAPLELLRARLAAGEKIAEATDAVRSRTVFTTHTPVPAGHDRFNADLVSEALGGYQESLGWSAEQLMDLGRVRRGDAREPLCMTVLAMKLSRGTNGVSALHGAVSREMWKDLYPLATHVDDVPIGHVTNGVHPLFWLSPALRALYDEHLPGWREKMLDAEFWQGAHLIPDAALWRAHQRSQAELAEAMRKRGIVLNSGALTLGFARRFAPYKRANLLFSQPERLEALLTGAHPVNLIFAGKAHPRDLHGQALLAEVVRWTNTPPFRGRIAFLEEYDLTLGARLTQGVDVWVNTPRRPREASGTSGQKAAINGVLNLSVLDGWWPEAYDGQNGWAVGDTRSYATQEEQDAADAESLYAALEGAVVPLYFQRESGLPTAWIQRMKGSIASCMPRFNTHRMVADYVEKAYRG